MKPEHWSATRSSSACPRTPVILHMHIFKNGGTTIDSILEREFHRSFATLHGPSDESTLSGDDVIAFIEQHPATQVISSHHLRYPKPRINGYSFLDICMLRHPLDRLHSMYRYLRKKHSEQHPLRELARAHECGPFFVACMNEYRSWIENVQVAFLSSRQNADDADALTRALARLHEIDLLGTTDLFDESLVTWEYLLYPLFPGISFHFLAQNVTRSREQPLDSRLQDFRNECGSDVFDQLLALNSGDLTLFEAATHYVEHRFLARPLCHEWLREFRARNFRLVYLQSHCLKARCRNLVSGSPRLSSAFEWALNAFEPKPLTNAQHHVLADPPELPENAGAADDPTPRAH